jgi:hypothetical protein
MIEKKDIELYRKRLSGLSVAEIATLEGMETADVEAALKRCQPEVREELRIMLQDRLEWMTAEISAFEKTFNGVMTLDQKDTLIKMRLEVHDRLTKLLGLNASPLDGLGDDSSVKFVGIVLPGKAVEVKKDGP